MFKRFFSVGLIALAMSFGSTHAASAISVGSPTARAEAQVHLAGGIFFKKKHVRRHGSHRLRKFRHFGPFGIHRGRGYHNRHDHYVYDHHGNKKRHRHKEYHHSGKHHHGKVIVTDRYGNPIGLIKSGKYLSQR